MSNEFIEKFKVAGMFVGDRKKNVKRYVSRYSKFELVREPDNKYDANAVLVMLPIKGGQHRLDIGYVPKEIAERIAPEMDAGVKFAATFRIKIINDKTGALIHLYLNLNQKHK